MDHKKTRKTLAFRLMVSYCGLFVLSSLALFDTAYDLLSSSMQRRDQDAIQSKLRELPAEYRRGGTVALERTVTSQQNLPGNRNSFIVRVAQADNKTSFLYVPSRWAKIDPEELQRNTESATPWVHIRVKDLDDDDDDDEIVEVASVRLCASSITLPCRLVRVPTTARMCWNVSGISPLVFLAV